MSDLVFETRDTLDNFVSSIDLSLSISTESIGTENSGYKPVPSVGESTIFFQLPADMAKCTITAVAKDDGGLVYNVLLYGVIANHKDYMSLSRMCSKSTEKDDIDIYVHSPGGSVTVAAGLLSKLANLSANVRFIAFGDVMSAATLFFTKAFDSMKVCKYARFMYHMSSTGGMSHTAKLIEDNKNIFEYISDYLVEANKSGLLTTDELDTIIDKRQDVFILANEMCKRLNQEIYTKKEF